VRRSVRLRVLAVFRSATVVRSVIQVVPISESYRRRFVPGSCTDGPSHAVYRYPEKTIFFAASSDRVSPTTLVGF
jgi:hypothetical protein